VLTRRVNGTASVVDEQTFARVRGEYSEMPGLQLTLAQAARLWHLSPLACESLLAALVEQRFLVRTKNGAFVRAAT
jgi:hypothetical protein